MAKISVVIPVYKVPFDYLNQCIHSVINQSLKDIEIIIVDDGSPKEWSDYCDSMSVKDERIKVIHKSNGGLSDARNSGLKAVTSPWVTFVDGDDWIEEDFLEYAINRISKQKKEDQSDIYHYSGFRNFPNKEIIGTPYFSDGTKFKSYEELEDLQSRCLTNHVSKYGNIKGITISSGCLKVYNTDFLRINNLFFPLVPYDEDSLFYLDSIEKAKSIEYVSKPVYHYRFNSNSITTKYRPQADKEQEIYLNYIFDFAKRNNKSQEFRKKINMRVMTQMLVINSLKFFHEQNPDPLYKKYIEARKCFMKEPYRSALKQLNPKDMRRNPKIKYYLLKFGLYGLVAAGKKHNQKKLNKK